MRRNEEELRTRITDAFQRVAARFPAYRKQMRTANEVTIREILERYYSDDAINSLRDQLVIDIGRAFEGVKRDGGVTLHETQVLDDYGGEAERIAARKLDFQERWQDLPDELLEAGWPLVFLDSNGFRFHLPAYMIWRLRYPFVPELGSDYLCGMLVGCTSSELWNLGLFDAEQAKTIYRFLKFCVEVETELPDFDADDLEFRESLEKWLALSQGV
ncbi:DUF6714 family protein [Singulisphaera sp. Ch08]|uniref:DUF6714 family protein n=1 Tax=Singulisphaera sp. Ch08 TaxID=3120278 RepID=A0AAU7C5U3_9BACT